jgi:hypothetical protein
MPIGAVRISNLEGQLVDGPSRVDMSVDVELESLGDTVVLTQTTKHPAAPDRTIRSEFSEEAARELKQALERTLED